MSTSRCDWLLFNNSGKRSPPDKCVFNFKKKIVPAPCRPSASTTSASCRATTKRTSTPAAPTPSSPSAPTWWVCTWTCMCSRVCVQTETERERDEADRCQLDLSLWPCSSSVRQNKNTHSLEGNERWIVWKLVGVCVYVCVRALRWHWWGPTTWWGPKLRFLFRTDGACSCGMLVIIHTDHRTTTFVTLCVCVCVSFCRTQNFLPSTAPPWKTGRVNALMTLPKATLAW